MINPILPKRNGSAYLHFFKNLKHYIDISVHRCLEQPRVHVLRTTHTSTEKNRTFVCK